MSAAESDVSVPLHMHTEDEEFIVELDEDDPTSPNSAFSSNGRAVDKIRLKRRRRCGQCGPCQVKENCLKCHFCLRRDVLKQSCIYRKCIYLRSKPKPCSSTRSVECKTTKSQILSSFSQTKENVDCVYSSPPPPPSIGGVMSPEQSFGHSFHNQQMLPGGDFKPPFPPTPIPPSPVPQSQIMSPHLGHQQCMSSPPLNPSQLSCSSSESPASQFPQHQQSVQQPQTLLPPHPPHPPSLPQQMHNNGENVSQTSMVHGFPHFGGFGANQPFPPSASFPRPPFDRQPGFHPCAPPNSAEMLKSPMLPRFPAGYCLPPVRPPDNFLPNPFAHNSQHPNFPMYNPHGAPFLYLPPPMNRHPMSDLINNGHTPNMSFHTIESDSVVMQEKYGCHRGQNMSSLMRDFYLRRNSETLSECDVISVDDFRMNAFIRSEGDNSLCIEIDEDSISAPDRSSSLSPASSIFSSVSTRFQRQLSQPTKEDNRSHVMGNVVLKQDLGEEGIIQLEIPGHRVKIENTPLHYDLAKYSSNFHELMSYIERGPQYDELNDSFG